MKSQLLVVSLVLLLCLTFACQNKAEKAELEKFRTQAKLEAQNIGLIEKLTTELNKGNTAIFYELYAPDAKYYFPSRIATPLSRDDLIANTKKVFTACPDQAYEIKDIFAAKDRVALRLISRGTHLADMGGMTATGKKLETSAIIIMRIKDGKVAEEFEEVDMLGLFQQLDMELRPKEAKKLAAL